MRLNRHAGVRNRLTLTDYYKYRIAVREYINQEDDSIVNWSSLHHAGKLFQQYVIDAWIKVDSNNINYFRMNQAQLRREFYDGLMDHLNHQCQENNYLPGRVVILPSTHQVCLLFLILSNFH